MVRRFLVFIVLGVIILSLIGVVFAQETGEPENNRRSVSGHGGSSSGSGSGSKPIEEQRPSLRIDCINAVAKFLIEEGNITMCEKQKEEIISKLTNQGLVNEDTPYDNLYNSCGGKGNPIWDKTITGNIQLAISNICREVKTDCMCKIRLDDLGEERSPEIINQGDITLYPGQWAKITVVAKFEGLGHYEKDTYTVYCGPSPNTITPSTITISPGERKVLPNEDYFIGDDLKRTRSRLGYKLTPISRTIEENIQIFGSPDEVAMKECLEVPDSENNPKGGEGIETALTPEFSLFGVLVAMLGCVGAILGVRKRS